MDFYSLVDQLATSELKLLQHYVSAYKLKPKWYQLIIGVRQNRIRTNADAYKVIYGEGKPDSKLSHLKSYTTEVIKRLIVSGSLGDNPLFSKSTKGKLKNLRDVWCMHELYARCGASFVQGFVEDVERRRDSDLSLEDNMMFMVSKYRLLSRQMNRSQQVNQLSSIQECISDLGLYISAESRVLGLSNEINYYSDAVIAKEHIKEKYKYIECDNRTHVDTIASICKYNAGLSIVLNDLEQLERAINQLKALNQGLRSTRNSNEFGYHLLLAHWQSQRENTQVSLDCIREAKTLAIPKSVNFYRAFLFEISLMVKAGQYKKVTSILSSSENAFFSSPDGSLFRFFYAVALYGCGDYSGSLGNFLINSDLYQYRNTWRVLMKCVETMTYLRLKDVEACYLSLDSLRKLSYTLPTTSNYIKNVRAVYDLISIRLKGSDQDSKINELEGLLVEDEYVSSCSQIFTLKDVFFLLKQ